MTFEGRWPKNINFHLNIYYAGHNFGMKKVPALMESDIRLTKFRFWESQKSCSYCIALNPFLHYFCVLQTNSASDDSINNIFMFSGAV